MSFPNILKTVYNMGNSDINVVGQYLGYDWNDVCDHVREAEFYAQDGAGAFTVTRESNNDYSENEVINKIFTEIFKNYPHVNKIQVVNES